MPDKSLFFNGYFLFLTLLMMKDVEQHVPSRYDYVDQSENEY